MMMATMASSQAVKGARPCNAYIACSKSNPFGAQGVGDAFVLDDAEQATVTAAVNGYNAYITAKATALGFAYVDPNVLLSTLRTAAE